MRRETRESSYSDMEDIEAIKRSFRESSQTASEKHESRRSEERSVSIQSGRKDLLDLERRYSRGRSEERYPREFRGRSLSPRREAFREPRSASVVPSVCRALSPIREKTYTLSAIEETSKSSNEQTTQTAEVTKKLEDYPYFIPRYFYPYYRPYYRLSPSELSAVVTLARSNVRRYLTPRPFDYINNRPYDFVFNRPEPKETHVPTAPAVRAAPAASSPSYTSYTSTCRYDSSKFRSFYTYPNLQYTKTLLPRLNF